MPQKWKRDTFKEMHFTLQLRQIFKDTWRKGETWHTFQSLCLPTCLENVLIMFRTETKCVGMWFIKQKTFAEPLVGEPCTVPLLTVSLDLWKNAHFLVSEQFPHHRPPLHSVMTILPYIRSCIVFLYLRSIKLACFALICSGMFDWQWYCFVYTAMLQCQFCLRETNAALQFSAL